MDKEEDKCMAIVKIRIDESTAKIKWWIRPWIARCFEWGAYHSLIKETQDEDESSFGNSFRQCPNLFDELEFIILKKIQEHDTTYKNNISTCERLAITLPFHRFR